jgi:hypothetical protein
MVSLLVRYLGITLNGIVNVLGPQRRAQRQKCNGRLRPWSLVHPEFHLPNVGADSRVVRVGRRENNTTPLCDLPGLSG